MTLIEIDQYLFHVLNADWTNVLFDYIMPIWRNKYFWLPVYIFIISFSIANYGKQAYYLIIFLILTAGTADLISSEMIKKNVQRLRPCNNTELVEVRSLVRCGSGYSFTSNHAANHFAVSFFLILTIARGRKRLRWLLLFWAVSIAYAQVYVGVHYPIDVISGGILGILIARLFALLFHKWHLEPIRSS